jgi:predicted Zn-dependent protease with MMP-like domain
MILDENCEKSAEVIRANFLPNIDYFYNLSLDIVESLPDDFSFSQEKLTIKVENYPEQNILDELKIANRNDLLGLYRGIPTVPNANKKNILKNENIIFLYRGPLIKYSFEHREPVESIVKHVLIHEIGHHFGLSAKEIRSMVQAQGGAI